MQHRREGIFRHNANWYFYLFFLYIKIVLYSLTFTSRNLNIKLLSNKLCNTSAAFKYLIGTFGKNAVHLLKCTKNHYQRKLTVL